MENLEAKRILTDERLKATIARVDRAYEAIALDNEPDNNFSLNNELDQAYESYLKACDAWDECGDPLSTDRSGHLYIEKEDHKVKQLS